MSRWWAVALLSLSVGLNLGLVVAVVQQRFAPPPAPAVVVVPSPAGLAAAPAQDASPLPPAATTEIGPPPVTVASPLRAAPVPEGERERWRGAGEDLPPLGGLDEGELAEGYGAGPGEPPRPDGRGPGARRGPGDGGMQGPGGGGLRGAGPSPARLEEMAERIGVPPADRPRFIALQRRFIAETRERRVELDTVRRSLRSELLAADPDPDRLHALVDASARLQGALERAFVEHVLAARELLDGQAERRYLEFLSRLGPRAGAPGPPLGQGQARPGDRGQRQRPPWGRGPGRDGGGGGQGFR